MSGRNLLIGALIALVLFLAGLAAFFYGKLQTKVVEKPPATEEARPQPEASPTPQPETPASAPTTVPETFKVESVSVSVSPTLANTCPKTFSFTAVIKTNLAGTVKYRFERSDGTMGAEKTLVFNSPGSQNVTDSWSLSANTSGWARVKIISPNILFSNKANFSLTCPTAFAVTGVTTSVSPGSSDTCQPATTFTANGSIAINQPGTVTYKWERSDGSVGAIQLVTITGSGPQAVSDTWTLNSAGDRWFKLHVLTPNDLSSAQANFSLTCPFRVNSVAASVSPTSHSGACPKTFNFSAVITSNAAGIVSYKWARSDGAGAPTQTATFVGPGTQTVTDSWSLSANGTRWERVDVSSPNSISSNQAEFSLTCL